MTHGPWFADSEGTIKRQRFDDDGNRDGYELLLGAYPPEWGAAHDLLKVLRDLMSAAMARESALGDLCHLLECKANLERAITAARDILDRVEKKS